MTRHWSVRVLRAFLALWFVLSVGEPSIVQFCPMHGGLLGELAGRATDAGMSGMDMSDMPGMTTPGTAHGRDASSGGRGHDAHQPTAPAAHHHCTCIACCVGAGASVLPGAHDAFVAATWRLTAAPVIATAERLPRPAPAHAQPPGTGPPRAA